MVAAAVEKNLRLVFESAKGAGMNDAVAVALIMRAPFGRDFLVFTAASVAAELRVGRENLAFDLFKFLTSAGHNLIWIIFSSVARLVKPDARARIIHQFKMFIHGINPAVSLDGKCGDQNVVPRRGAALVTQPPRESFRRIPRGIGHRK